ncbi:MAG: M1 family aminopeptidase [Polyangiaceae bacterium]
MELVGADGGAIPARYTREPGHLRIDLGGPAAGRSVRIRYAVRSSEGFVVRDTEAYTAFDTREWLPCDFDPGHKATFDLEVTVPADWHVIGPTFDPAPTAGPHHLHLDVPHSAYLFGFAAGRYERVDGRAGELGAHFYAPSKLLVERAALRTQVLAEISSASAFYADKAGRLYPAADYSMVATGDNGGQEASFYSLGDVSGFEAFADEPKEDWLIVHELAHMWWGNALTCDRWADFWLNEAFAVFMTAAFKEVHTGRAGYDAEVALAWKKFDKVVMKGKDRPLVGAPDTDADHAGGPIVYSKGALVLFELRARVGDDAFWRGVRLYSEAGSVVRTEDLKSAMERASGADLGEFFRGWTEGLGAPTTSTRKE